MILFIFFESYVYCGSGIDELLALPEYSYEAIENVLNKIYICKMLKSEDRSIKSKKNRSTDYREVVVFDYNERNPLNFEARIILL